MNSLVCVTGVESTGKTASAQAIADFFGWAFVPEAARTDAAVREFRAGPDDLVRLADLQRDATSAALARTGTVSDACPLVLEVWAQVAFGCCPADSRADQQRVDLFLLCAPDLPWEPDPLRVFPDANRRWEIHRLFESLLRERGLPYVVLQGSGEERWRSALPAVRLLSE